MARSTGLSRRSVLTSGAAACGLMALGLPGCSEPEAPMPITIAGYPYDRVRALADGRVGIEGFDVSFEEDGIGLMNVHVFREPQTRAVTEVGLIPYLLAWTNDDFRDYALLPIPVLRLFRHKSIFIRPDRGIERPEDLKGRRVATVGYSSSGLTWVRGILNDEYGVAPEDLTWVITGADSAASLTGGASSWEKVLPKGLKVELAPEGKDDSDLLVAGDVDAIFHPAEPKAFVERHPKITRLFTDHRSVEKAYFKKTGIFPIMHMVAVHRELAKEHPALIPATFEAYSKAKKLDYRLMHKMGAYFSTLPWHGQELRETRALMGENFYPYGMEGSRKALDTALRYVFEQGLAKRLVKAEEIIHPAAQGIEEA